MGNTTKNIFAGTPEGTSAFDISFAFSDASDVAVARTPASGGDVALRLGADYDIAVDPKSGRRTLTLTRDPLRAAERLTVFRAQGAEHGVSLSQSDRFPIRTVQEGFDRAQRFAEQLDTRLSGTVRLPQSAYEADEASAMLELPGDRRAFAGTLLSWGGTPDAPAVKLKPMADFASAKELAAARAAMSREAREAVAAAVDSALETAGRAAAQASADCEGAAESAREASASAANAAACEGAASGHAQGVEGALAEVRQALGESEAARADARQAAQTALAQKDCAAASAAEAARSLTDLKAIANNLSYKGAWNASANTAPAATQAGQYWIISTAGTFGGVAWAAGDAALYTGSAWSRLALDTLLSAEKAERLADRAAMIAARGMIATHGGGSARGLGYIQTQANGFGRVPFTLCLSYRRRTPWVSGANIVTKIHNGAGANENHFLIYPANTNTKMHFVATNKANVSLGLLRQYDLSSFPADGKLHTVVFSLSDGEEFLARCYVDGVEQAYTYRSNGAFTGDFSNAYPMEFGATTRNAATPDTGDTGISRVKIFNHVLPKSGGLYSVDDYTRGLDEPAALRDPTAAEHATLSLDDSPRGLVCADLSGNCNHAILYGSAASERVPGISVSTDALTWDGTADSKAFLTNLGNTTPAGCRVVARLKASAACTVALANGLGEPYAAAQALAAGAWAEIPAIYPGAAGRVTVTPAAAFSGTINVQLTIEPLN